MGTIKDIFDLVTSVTEVGFREARKQRKRLYDLVVSSSFDTIQQVHKDYMKKLTRLLAILEVEELPDIEIVQWLRKSSVEYCEERQRLKIFSSGIDIAKDYLKNSFPGDSEICSAFSEYCIAITGYFHRSFSFSDTSWFEYIIHAFEEQVLHTQETLKKLGVTVTKADLEQLKKGVHKNSELQISFKCNRVFGFNFETYHDGGGISPTIIKEILKELPKRYTSVVKANTKLTALIGI